MPPREHPRWDSASWHCTSVPPAALARGDFHVEEEAIRGQKCEEGGGTSSGLHHQILCPASGKAVLVYSGQIVGGDSNTNVPFSQGDPGGGCGNASHFGTTTSTGTGHLRAACKYTVTKRQGNN